MAYDATVIEVMIASPSDVAEERQIVREVLHEWNALHARERGVVLMPAGWETHSAPDLGGRAQDLINKRVLAHCDVLVGIFWTRVGSPTGSAVSGSVEEIEEHLKLGRPVMLYFSDAPVKPDSVDPAQYGKLVALKEWAKERGLVAFYESAGDFRERLRRDLSLNLRDNPHLRSLVDAEEDSPDFVATFEAALAREPAPLSEEAREALRTAATDKNGIIMILRHMGGTAIQSAGRAFCDAKDRRAVARWTAAVEELRDRDLVRDHSGKGEVFELSDAGYRLAETLG